ncbi:MAG: hypothetical protein HC808_10990 [Candidatus Competibacteraceae bacterium]|nr:hypothetical protein [Candidatus Competibacteraceae bacterium]
MVGASPVPVRTSDKLQGDLGALKMATFMGSVNVLHRQFELAGDKLALHMRDVAQDGESQAGDAAPKAARRDRESLVDRIQVDGHVRARSRDASADGPVAIASDHLELKAGVDETGRSMLERMRAWAAKTDTSARV